MNLQPGFDLQMKITSLFGFTCLVQISIDNSTELRFQYPALFCRNTHVTCRFLCEFDTSRAFEKKI